MFMKERWQTLQSARAGVLLGGLALCLTVGACNHQENARYAAALTGGDPQQGKLRIQQYGCQTCHTIPGIRGADGLVGPNLDKLPQRVYVAGVLPNSPANLVRWIQNPQAVDEKTAMPNLNVPAAEARDIAAYLYTLR
jgi:cytochrome c